MLILNYDWIKSAGTSFSLEISRILLLISNPEVQFILHSVHFSHGLPEISTLARVCHA
jgi:hypothetical protein